MMIRVFVRDEESAGVCEHRFESRKSIKIKEWSDGDESDKYDTHNGDTFAEKCQNQDRA